MQKRFLKLVWGLLIAVVGIGSSGQAWGQFDGLESVRSYAGSTGATALQNETGRSPLYGPTNAVAAGKQVGLSFIYDSYKFEVDDTDLEILLSGPQLYGLFGITDEVGAGVVVQSQESDLKVDGDDSDIASTSQAVSLFGSYGGANYSVGLEVRYRRDIEEDNSSFSDEDDTTLYDSTEDQSLINFALGVTFSPTSELRIAAQYQPQAVEKYDFTTRTERTPSDTGATEVTSSKSAGILVDQEQATVAARFAVQSNLVLMGGVQRLFPYEEEHEIREETATGGSTSTRTASDLGTTTVSVGGGI